MHYFNVVQDYSRFLILSDIRNIIIYVTETQLYITVKATEVTCALDLGFYNFNMPNGSMPGVAIHITASMNGSG